MPRSEVLPKQSLKTYSSGLEADRAKAGKTLGTLASEGWKELRRLLVNTQKIIK